MEKDTREQIEVEIEAIEVHTSHGAILPPPPEKAEQHFSDEVLTQELREALRVDQRLTQAHVVGDVWDSIAYLAGEASRPEEITAAEEVACSLPGIRNVRNEIVINPGMQTPESPTEVI